MNRQPLPENLPAHGRPSARRTAAVALTTLAALCLAACQPKQPPSCESAEVQDVLKSIVVSNAQASLGGRPLKDEAGQVTPASLYFYSSINTTLSNVFDAGVSKDTQLRSCSATLELDLASGSASRLIAGSLFSAQIPGVEVAPDGWVKTQASYQVRLSDSTGQVQVQSASLGPLVELVSYGHLMIAPQLAWAGTWDGIYKCQRSAEAMSLPEAVANAHESFEHPLTESLLGGTSLEIERTTAGGGYEKLAMRIGPSIEVRVEGANTAQDRWKGTLRGAMTGNQLSAKGTLLSLPGVPVSHCDIALQFTPLDKDGIAAEFAKRKAAQ
ncbi:hypothetical protein [Comamonas sp.]|uniref:hypothetical protein n=1 Tax=Comamonas sp. TaxID=34028 RepID=UPI0028B12974|nr:hypothetical protein [Comamonas sp.]